jgi:glycosyltransferase involved in cell wall biosynthesis
MSAVNAAVYRKLRTAGAQPLAINMAAPSLNRSLMARLGRLPRVMRGLCRLVLARGLRGGTLYMSVSGGFGQVYELLFLLMARPRGMRVYLHHHSSAYLDRPSQLTRLLVMVAGSNAVHIMQSPGLAERLSLVYGVAHVIPVSNAVFFIPANGARPTRARQTLRVLGFLSNISQEKGVFDFLDLMAEIQARGLPLKGKLAGPFVDARTERLVREQLGHLHVIDYVGPKYGEEKDAFYDEIDVLVFPTRYVHETEGLVVHEAMRSGLPVISYGRGAIPEILTPRCGRVVPPGEPFLPAALEQIEAWCAEPEALRDASRAAARRFTQTHEASVRSWERLLHDILHDKNAMRIIG